MSVPDNKWKEELVTFSDVSFLYPASCDVTVNYTLGSRVCPGSLDWIGIFSCQQDSTTGLVDQHSYLNAGQLSNPLAFQWAPTKSKHNKKQKKLWQITFPAKIIQSLESNTNSYYFAYVKKPREVLGRSPTFMIRDDTLCGDLEPECVSPIISWNEDWDVADPKGCLSSDLSDIVVLSISPSKENAFQLESPTSSTSDGFVVTKVESNTSQESKKQMKKQIAKVEEKDDTLQDIVDVQISSPPKCKHRKKERKNTKKPKESHETSVSKFEENESKINLGTSQELKSAFIEKLKFVNVTTCDEDSDDIADVLLEAVNEEKANKEMKKSRKDKKSAPLVEELSEKESSFSTATELEHETMRKCEMKKSRKKSKKQSKRSKQNTEEIVEEVKSTEASHDAHSDKKPCDYSVQKTTELKKVEIELPMKALNESVDIVVDDDNTTPLPHLEALSKRERRKLKKKQNLEANHEASEKPESSEAPMKPEKTDNVSETVEPKDESSSQEKKKGKCVRINEQTVEKPKTFEQVFDVDDTKASEPFNFKNSTDITECSFEKYALRKRKELYRKLKDKRKTKHRVQKKKTEWQSVNLKYLFDERDTEQVDDGEADSQTVSEEPIVECGPSICIQEKPAVVDVKPKQESFNDAYYEDNESQERSVCIPACLLDVMDNLPEATSAENTEAVSRFRGAMASSYSRNPLGQLKNKYKIEKKKARLRVKCSGKTKSALSNVIDRLCKQMECINEGGEIKNQLPGTFRTESTDQASWPELFTCPALSTSRPLKPFNVTDSSPERIEKCALSYANVVKKIPQAPEFLTSDRSVDRVEEFFTKDQPETVTIKPTYIVTHPSETQPSDEVPKPKKKKDKENTFVKDKQAQPVSSDTKKDENTLTIEDITSPDHIFIRIEDDAPDNTETIKPAVVSESTSQINWPLPEFCSSFVQKSQKSVEYQVSQFPPLSSLVDEVKAFGNMISSTVTPKEETAVITEATPSGESSSEKVTSETIDPCHVTLLEMALSSTLTENMELKDRVGCCILDPQKLKRHLLELKTHPMVKHLEKEIARLTASSAEKAQISEELETATDTVLSSIISSETDHDHDHQLLVEKLRSEVNASAKAIASLENQLKITAKALSDRNIKLKKVREKKRNMKRKVKDMINIMKKRRLTSDQISEIRMDSSSGDESQSSPNEEEQSSAKRLCKLGDIAVKSTLNTQVENKMFAPAQTSIIPQVFLSGVSTGSQTFFHNNVQSQTTQPVFHGFSTQGTSTITYSRPHTSANLQTNGTFYQRPQEREVFWFTGSRNRSQSPLLPLPNSAPISNRRSGILPRPVPHDITNSRFGVPHLPHYWRSRSITPKRKERRLSRSPVVKERKAVPKSLVFSQNTGAIVTELQSVFTTPQNKEFFPTGFRPNLEKCFEDKSKLQSNFTIDREITEATRSQNTNILKGNDKPVLEKSGFMFSMNNIAETKERFNAPEARKDSGKQYEPATYSYLPTTPYQTTQVTTAAHSNDTATTSYTYPPVRQAWTIFTGKDSSPTTQTKQNASSLWTNNGTTVFGKVMENSVFSTAKHPMDTHTCSSSYVSHKHTVGSPTLVYPKSDCSINQQSANLSIGLDNYTRCSGSTMPQKDSLSFDFTKRLIEAKEALFSGLRK